MKEVLIVGAGPTGLSLACFLAAKSIPVTVIDQAPHGSHLSRGNVLHARTLEIFERAGLLPKLLEAGQKVTTIRVFSGEQELPSLNLENVRSSQNYLLDLRQNDIERILMLELAARGVTLQRNTSLSSFVQQDDHVVAQLHSADGRDFSFEAGYLLACDGTQSTVRALLDAPVQSYPSESYFVADFELPSPVENPSWIWTLAGGSYRLLLPYDPRRWRLIASLQYDAVGLPIADIDHYMKHNPFPVNPRFNVEWSSVVTVQPRMVSRLQWQRAFLLGDAAHTFTPVGNQGMNLGIQEAFNLAWKLDLVLHHAAEPRLLQTYASECLAVARQCQRFTRELRSLSDKTNSVGQFFGRFLLPLLGGLDVIHKRMVHRMEELDFNYRQSPIVSQHIGKDVADMPQQHFRRGPQPGDIIPDVPVFDKVTGASIALREMTSRHKFACISFTTNHNDLDDRIELARCLRWCRDHCGAFVNLLLISGKQVPPGLEEFSDLLFLDPRFTAHDRFGLIGSRSSIRTQANRDALYLIRPDGYVAYRSLPPHLDSFKKAVSSHFRFRPSATPAATRPSTP